MKPTITIIMATYNRAHFILETLHSIQNQTYENWECIIIDDGGTDNTQEVITPIKKEIERIGRAMNQISKQNTSKAKKAEQMKESAAKLKELNASLVTANKKLPKVK